MIPFRERTREIMAAVVDAPGHKDDGKALGETWAGGGSRYWGARFGGYSWSIVFEPGVPEWSDEERRQSVGYTATYRRVGHNSSNQTIPVDGGPFVDMADAERACHRLWHSIKHAN